MIQLNLLPDVKEKYIKAQRMKRLVFGGSFVAIAASLVFVGILGSVVYGAQKLKLNSLDKSIKDSSSKINETNDLDKILTVQNQLSSLTALHDGKAVSSRLFTYLPQITPNDVSISNLNVFLGPDTEKTIAVTGSSKSLESINRFVDTLKFTKYVTEDSTDEQPAFSSVVLTSFGRSEQESSYTINLKYDPVLFDSKSKVTLIVPKQVTTQSTTGRPSALFKQPEEGTQQ